MEKTIIIAEAGVNHNGDMNIAKQLIDAAAEAGADYVKFQTFIAEELVTKDAQKASYQKETVKDGEDTQFKMLKKLELSQEQHFELIEYCKTKGINFLSTAFDHLSIEFLNDLGLDFYKIPSGEITNLPYLKRISKLGIPVILSTGMANTGEIEEAIDVLEHGGVNRDEIIVLHCNTEYPTPMEDVNLKAMNTISQAFGVLTGYSDHTLGIEIPIAAVAKGAVCIEKHFTIDNTMEGPDHQASLEPHELKAMVRGIRNIEKALGDGIKRPSPSEERNKNVVRKSIHLAKDCLKGHVVTAEDLHMRRPGDGISPMLMEKIIGLKLSTDLNKDHKLSFENFA